MKNTRRDFLQRSALAATGLLLAPAAAVRAADGTKPTCYDPYGPVTLGPGKLKTSRFCLGTGMRGGNRQSNHTRMGREKFEALIRGSYERGARMFDLADLYGTHPYVVPALKGIPRDRFEITTKMWFLPGGIPEPERPDADVVVPRFLKELQTDYIDLFLLHCVTSAKWPEECRRQMDILSKFKEQGKIRALGVSCHSLVALEAAAKEPWVDSVHTRINPFAMSMDGPVDKVLPVLKQLKAAGKGVVGMKIVGEGRLRDQPEKRAESVKFVLDSGCVDVLNVGCESLEQVDDIATLVRKVEVQKS